MPVPRQTSQARAIRWLSVGRRRRGRRRVRLGEARVQRGWADLLQQGPGLRPRFRGGAGDVREALGQRGEIKAAAAGEDRQAARLARAVHFGECRIAPPRDAAWFGGRADAVEDMGDPGLVLRRRPRGQHAQFAVNLHGVGVDDRAAEPLGQFQGERRLPAGGGAGDDQGEGGHGGRRPKSGVVAPLGMGFLFRAAFRRFQGGPDVAHGLSARSSGRKTRTMEAARADSS